MTSSPETVAATRTRRSPSAGESETRRRCSVATPILLRGVRGGQADRPAQADDRDQEGREEDLDADHDQRRRGDRQADLAQRAEAAVDPDADHDRRHDEPDDRDDPAENQTVLEPEA